MNAAVLSKFGEAVLEYDEAFCRWLNCPVGTTTSIAANAIVGLAKAKYLEAKEKFELSERGQRLTSPLETEGGATPEGMPLAALPTPPYGFEIISHPKNVNPRRKKEGDLYWNHAENKWMSPVTCNDRFGLSDIYARRK